MTKLNVDELLSQAEYKMLPVGKLGIKWAGAQRRLSSDAHAKNIAANFDPDKFGTIEVTLPDEKGLHHVIDGFNRVQAVMLLWDRGQHVPCKILPVKDPVRAAQIFLGMNGPGSRRAVSAIDNFRVGITAGDPEKIAINKIIRSLGYKIDTSGKLEGGISAVSALQKVYTMYGPDVLKAALSLIQATWGMDPNSVIGPIILGYSSFIAEYGQFNWGRLKENIQKRFTPGQLLGAARSLKESERNGLNDAMVHVLVNVYNYKLKTGALVFKR